jgi:hypothetical protein
MLAKFGNGHDHPPTMAKRSWMSHGQADLSVVELKSRHNKKATVHHEYYYDGQDSETVY